MDKITHQVRAEHWTQIINECLNSGMPKIAWCRANESSEKKFFYWQKILRREAFENSQNASLPGIVGPDKELVPATFRTVSFTVYDKAGNLIDCNKDLPEVYSNREYCCGCSACYATCLFMNCNETW